MLEKIWPFLDTAQSSLSALYHGVSFASGRGRGNGIDLEADLADHVFADEHLEAVRTGLGDRQGAQIDDQVAGLQQRARLVRDGDVHTLHTEHLLAVLVDQLDPHRMVRPLSNGSASKSATSAQGTWHGKSFDPIRWKMPSRFSLPSTLTLAASSRRPDSFDLTTTLLFQLVVNGLGAVVILFGLPRHRPACRSRDSEFLEGVGCVGLVILLLIDRKSAVVGVEASSFWPRSKYERPML